MAPPLGTYLFKEFVAHHGNLVNEECFRGEDPIVHGFVLAYGLRQLEGRVLGETNGQVGVESYPVYEKGGASRHGGDPNVPHDVGNLIHEITLSDTSASSDEHILTIAHIVQGALLLGVHHGVLLGVWPKFLTT